MLIKQVTLYTHLLKEMTHFYAEILGFPLISSTNIHFDLKIGESILTFQKSEDEEKPFYHFAFSIQENQFYEAKEWIKEKVNLNTEDGNDEVYFQALDAHSLYFLDPAGNIVEFIARHYLPSTNNQPFSIKSFLNISEISFTTKDVLLIGEKLLKFGIPVRNNKQLNDSFNFMGRNGSYLLLGKEGRRWFFSDKDAEIYPVSIEFIGYKKVEIDEEGNVYLTET